MPISRETLDFLVENRFRNDRTWFHDHKEQFQRVVISPMAELVTQLAPTMRKIDASLVTEAKVDRTISRVYRDTRYSKDKSLYRSVMWCVFKKNKKEHPFASGFFFEFSPDGFRYGCGYYYMPPKLMETARELILSGDKTFLEAKAAMEKQRVFQMEGDSYKRARYKERSEDLRNWLNRKCICFVHNSTDFDLLFSPDLYQPLAEGFTILAPVYRFFCRAEDVLRLQG